MPDLYMDVDVNLSEVPVNLISLIDDTDFKSIEADVNYNATGLSLIWHFVTTAGAYSQTAVTPTGTGGAHDWVEQGNGMFTIEIPATLGTINNDTEGFGWFSGVATGILPWRGPVIGFRKASMNNIMIDNGTLQDNLEDMFDGTGYAGGTEKLDIAVVEIANIDFSTTMKASINTEADTALTDYDPPTRTEATADKDAIITQVDANETKIDTLTTEFGKVPKSDGTATWNTTALASLQTEATDALNAYDPPTRAELTTDKDSIITEVNANETKIDTIKAETALIVADTNELQGLISSSKLPAQIKGMDADTLTASALKTDAVTEIVDAITDAIEVNTSGKLTDEGETYFGGIMLKKQTQSDLYLGLYKDVTEPSESATLATITEPSGNGYARVLLIHTDWTEDVSIKGVFTNIEKLFTANGGNISDITGYFISTTISGTTGKLITVRHLAASITIIDGESQPLTPIMDVR